MNQRWGQSEDDQLKVMRSYGHDWIAIGAVLSRSASACKSRFHDLRTQMDRAELAATDQAVEDRRRDGLRNLITRGQAGWPKLVHHDPEIACRIHARRYLEAALAEVRARAA